MPSWLLVPLIFVPLGAALLSMAGTGQSSRDTPGGYQVARSVTDAAALWSADDAAWARASAIVYGEAPFTTAFRALWTDDALWLRFDVTDRDPWHTLGERDDPLWNEEVVEIFIDPDGDLRNYAEIEISPANVVCDLLMRRGDPDKEGVLDWDFDGLETRTTRSRDAPAAAVRADGWQVVAMLPWRGFATLPETAVALPPAAGDRWRFNVFRIKRPYGPAEPEREVILSAWSPVPGGSFHVPEVFRVMEFVE